VREYGIGIYIGSILKYDVVYYKKVRQWLSIMTMCKKRVLCENESW
jgi:hypothetical protein